MGRWCGYPSSQSLPDFAVLQLAKAVEVDEKFDPKQSTILVAKENPIFMRKDLPECFQWRIRNLPYPKEATRESQRTHVKFLDSKGKSNHFVFAFSTLDLPSNLAQFVVKCDLLIRLETVVLCDICRLSPGAHDVRTTTDYLISCAYAFHAARSDCARC